MIFRQGKDLKASILLGNGVVRTERISVRQLGAVVLVFLVAGFDLFEPRITAAQAGPGAFWSLILAFGVALLMTAVLLELGLRFGPADVVRYARSLFGPYLGQAAGLLYLLVILFGGTARPVFEAGVVGRTAFGWSPPVVLAVLFLAVAVAGYVARRGLFAVARLAEYGAVVAVLLVLIVGVSVLPKVNWANYSPVPLHGWAPVWRGAGTFLTRFSLAYILLFFLPRTENAAGARGPTFATVGLVAVLLGAGILAIGIHGAPVVAATFLPAWQLVRDSVFGRAAWLADVAGGLWILGLVLQAAIGYWLVTVTLAETMERDFRRLIVPVGSGTLVLAVLLWSNIGQSFIVLAQYFRLLAYLAGMAVPALLLLLAAWQPGPRAGEENP